MCNTPANGRDSSGVRAPGSVVSPRAEMRGATVLLTGSLGFLGSVVLEQLLRLTEVKRVYLLVRGKKTQTAAQRVDKLLCGALFHALHKQVAAGGPNVFERVQAVEGDLTLPGLGLSAADTAALHAEVDHVIHCAANIELDADIQKSLKHNYFGTKALMELASRCGRLRSFVHVSTYFVNNHMPRNSVVKEAMHPLPLVLGGKPVGHEEYVEALMAMTNEDANAEALGLMGRHNFNSTYAFGKHLTERLVEATCVRPGVHRAIVRPSLISALQGAPYPGYIFGYGGPSGYTMGYAVGFFQGVFSIAFGSDYIMDIIPCDTVAAVTIGAAVQASASFGQPDSGVAIYHACSAHCHPLTLGMVFDACSKFWRANPPPLTLPGTRYPVFETEHNPSERGIALGRFIAWVKIFGLSAVLQMLGKTREARALKNAYSAFSVYNTRRYDRSILSAVDNVYDLMARMPADERSSWPCVADASLINWYAYGYTVFAGVRRLLFRMDGVSTSELPHFFTYQAPAADVSVLRLSDRLDRAKLDALDCAAAAAPGGAAAPLADERASSTGSSADVDVVLDSPKRAGDVAGKDQDAGAKVQPPALAACGAGAKAAAA